MKKALKIAAWVLGCVVAVSVLLVGICAIIYSPGYIYRAIVNGESKITDYKFFPKRVIAKSAKPYQYEYALNDALGLKDIRFETDGAEQTLPLEELLAGNQTTSFIIIQDDKIVYEQYFNGYGKDSVETSFSSIKSLDSLMIGMAIEDGYIKSVKEPIVNYIPEFAGTEFADITIENLLMMRSKIDYVEGFAWFTDDAKTYYMPDLRNLALHHMRIDADYAGKFHYNNYHPLLLGIILERSTGRHVADYFQKKIWDKVGAQFDASWSIDSEKSGFEKMESGLNFRSIDYAKIGSMLLHRGNWNGGQVVNGAWLDQSTVAPVPLAQDDIDSDFLKGQTVGYQYMWYSTPNDAGGSDFSARGKFGQYLYVSPNHNTVIVRTGYGNGGIAWWPEVLAQAASLADAQ